MRIEKSASDPERSRRICQTITSSIAIAILWLAWTAAASEPRLSQADQFLAAAKYDEALDAYRRVANSAGDDAELVAQANRGVGRALRRLGQFDQSLLQEQANIRFARDHSLFEYEGHAVNALAVSYRRLGRQDLALDYYEQALAIRMEVGDPISVAASLNNIAIVYKSTGDVVTALRYYLQSLALQTEHGQSESEILRTLSNISSLFMDMDDPNEALRYAKQMQPYMDKLDSEFMRSMALRRMGAALMRAGEMDAAKPYLDQVLTMERASESSRLPYVLVYMAEFHERIGQLDQALQLAREAANIAQHVDIETQYGALSTLGRLQIDAGLIEPGITSLELALNLADGADMQLSKMSVLAELSDAYQKNGEIEQALSALRAHLSIRNAVSDAVIGRQIANLTHEQTSRNIALEMEKLRFSDSLKALELERRERQIMVAVLAVTVVLMVLVFVYWRYRITRRLASEDTLTSLRNRRYFMQALDRSLNSSSDDGPLTLAIIDLDHFKRINDQHGHLVGDQVLKQVSSLLRSQLAPALLARIGGEEFALLATEDTSRVVAKCNRALQVLSRHAIRAGDVQIELTASIGLTHRGHRIIEPASLLSEADAALYQAKSEGRNRLVVHAPDA